MKNKADKATELIKYRDLLIATIDYSLSSEIGRIKTPEFDSNAYFNYLKIAVEEQFKKGQLSKLKQWFADLTAPYRESIDLNFYTYLKTKTNCDFDTFKSFFKRIDNTLLKGRITTDIQFRDITFLYDHLREINSSDHQKIELLTLLLKDYEERKTQKTKA
ncbi:MAG: hypothetical protein HUU01_19255 [Saprospiraceae bacterium]|nr:hypothetical protein [Saprospiraceae bacterium]